MHDFKIGDVVTRKSYGGDVHFKIVDIINPGGKKPVYVLRGMLYRLHADCLGEDLVKHDTRDVHAHVRQNITNFKKHASTKSSHGGLLSFLNKLRTRPGRILHIDSSKEFLDMCLEHYREGGLNPIGIRSDESEQPSVVKRLLERYHADILVLTGHDSMKKSYGKTDSIEAYSNSRYFIEGVKLAREYEPSADKLCIFAGACQSYFEAIMSAGANFASSPGRVLINALDPAFVAEKVALTDSKRVVTPGLIAGITVSGADGIGGINTKGHLMM